MEDIVNMVHAKTTNVAAMPLPKNTYDDELKSFYNAANTAKANFDNIINFFNNRNTNANAESF